MSILSEFFQFIRIGEVLVGFFDIFGEFYDIIIVVIVSCFNYAVQYEFEIYWGGSVFDEEKIGF